MDNLRSDKTSSVSMRPLAQEGIRLRINLVSQPDDIVLEIAKEAMAIAKQRNLVPLSQVHVENPCKHTLPTRLENDNHMAATHNKVYEPAPTNDVPYCPECYYNDSELFPMEEFAEGWKHGQHEFIFAGQTDRLEYARSLSCLVIPQAC